MINQEVANYIDDNKLCSEYIFEDCDKFIDFLYVHGGRISAILWWDYCKMTEGSSIGSGGYKDTKNLEFMFAETQIYEDDFEGKSAIYTKWVQMHPLRGKIQSSNPPNFDYDFTTNEGCELHRFAVFCKIGT